MSDIFRRSPALRQDDVQSSKSVGHFESIRFLILWHFVDDLSNFVASTRWAAGVRGACSVLIAAVTTFGQSKFGLTALAFWRFTSPKKSRHLYSWDSRRAGSRGHHSMGIVSEIL